MVDGHRTGRTSSTTYGSLAGLAMVTAGWLSLPASVTSSYRCLPALAPSTYPAAPPAAMPKISPRPVSRQTRFGGLGRGGRLASRLGSRRPHSGFRCCRAARRGGQRACGPASGGSPLVQEASWVSPSGLVGHRSSRLSSTVPTTEATTENRIISRQPGQPPRGRICIRPGRMGWLLGLQVAGRSSMALLRYVVIAGPATE
jgi:hypothetical protein